MKAFKTVLIEKKKTNELHVVEVDGKEVGFIQRYNRSSAWNANIGIGAGAETLGYPTFDKKEAVARVVKKSGERPIEERFLEAHKSFRLQIAVIALQSGKPLMEVYRLWLDYCNAYSDQSNLLWEFIAYYATQLFGSPRPASDAQVEMAREAVEAIGY